MSVASPPLPSCGTTVQPALWSLQEPVALELAVTRVALGNDAWVDTMTEFIRGGDTLLDTLVARVPLFAERRPMYDKTVEVPRLSNHLDADVLGSLVPVVNDMAGILETYYRQAFPRVGINLYRHERDSVAWHADRVGRTFRQPAIAVVSLGAARPFLLRPVGGGKSRRFVLGSGDLLVMGGTCQHCFEHSVPKLSRPTGPRLSITFRHDPPPKDA